MPLVALWGSESGNQFSKSWCCLIYLFLLLFVLPVVFIDGVIHHKINSVFVVHPSIISGPSPQFFTPSFLAHPIPTQRLNRSRRDKSSISVNHHYYPPRIVPDLPHLVRFFDRTGSNMICKATGNPTPRIRWFSISSRPVRNDGGGLENHAAVDFLTHTTSSALNQTSFIGSGAKSVDSSYVSELGFTNLIHEAPQSHATKTMQHKSIPGDSLPLIDEAKTSKQLVVGAGWLNFTAAHSSTMRMVFFCQAENFLGTVRSRKMVIHQVPMPDANLRILYSTFPIKPEQKAVVTCQPEQEVFNRFLTVDFWEVYMNNTLISTIKQSFGRYSMINATKHPELHIRHVTEQELTSMQVRCVLQSIVDESVKVIRPERGRLQRLQFGFSYSELRTIGNEFSVERGSIVEFPWAVEGEIRVGVDWFRVGEHGRVAMGSFSKNRIVSSGTKTVASSSASDSSPATLDNPIDSTLREVSHLPGGTKFEYVDGSHGNLRLINISVIDSGQYVAESNHAARPLAVTFKVNVRAPLGVRVIPSQRTIDWGSRVELECQVTGHPRHYVYWLHNAHLVPRRHRVRSITRPANTSSADPTAPYTERLIIEAFTLDDVGVYQCIVENGQSTDRLARRVNIPDIANINLEEHPPLSFTPPISGEEMEQINDLEDNAEATSLLTMGQMKPSLSWQYPAVEQGSPQVAHVLLSIHSETTEVSLECRFAGNPTPRIEWFRDDRPIPLDESGVDTQSDSLDNSTAYTTIARLKLDIRKIPNLENLWTYGGEYRAVARNDHGQDDCRTYVLLETALKLRPFKPENPAIAGRSYTLKCYFIGNTIPTLQWHRIKNDREVQRIPVDHRHQLLEDGRLLRITEVNQEEDEADYRCTAAIGDRSANTTITLKVSHAPKLFELPRTRQVKHSREMLSYSCALQNRADKPWYAWWEFQPEGSNVVTRLPPSLTKPYKGFSVSYVDDMTSRADESSLPDELRDKIPTFVHNVSNAAVHVTVDDLRKEQHHGNLTCVVMNRVGEDRRSIRVTFIPELEFSIRPPNNKDVTLGQSIAIDCSAKTSELDPVVEWKYLQKTTGKYISVSELAEVTNQRIQQLTNGTLLLSYVDESDPREFLCFLKPGHVSTAAQRSSAVNLEVHIPARIDPISHVEKVRGSRFNLTCSVHGDPDDLRAAWHYRPFGQSKWQLIDKPCVVPAAVLDSNPFQSVESVGNLGNENDEDEVNSLIDCRDYATEGSESSVLFRQVSSFKPNKRGLDKQLQFFSVKEVHMGEYVCRASNLYNRDSSYRRTEVEQFVKLTVISVPGPVHIVSNSSHTTATTVSFAWQPPVHHGNKPVLGYRIRYSPHQPPTQDRESTKEKIPETKELQVDESTRRTELTKLKPYTVYHITVMAINEVGASKESVLLLTTQEAKPGGPVRQLVANGTASDTITVSWDNPAPEHLNGNVDRYWICRQRVNDSLTLDEIARLPWPEDESIDRMTGSVSTSTATMRGRFGHIHCAKLIRQRDYEVTGLPKFTAYAFRVICLNSKGPSPPAYTQARTLEDLPQAPPTDIRCAPSQHSIGLSWSPPHPDTINGILTKYYVNFFAVNIYGDETNSATQKVEGQTSVTLAGLLAYTNYTIRVAVSNRKGRGPASPRLICSTTEAPPTAPEIIKVNYLNSSCLIISWSHPRRPQGRTRQYCIEAVPLVELHMIDSSHAHDQYKLNCQLPDFSIPYNYYTYCGLSIGNVYNISVRAHNQYEGHKAWLVSIRPMANPPPMGIISIGKKINAQDKMRVMLHCQVIGDFQPEWSYPFEEIRDDVTLLDNGTLVIPSVRLSHSGEYKCSVLSDQIVYDLTVQEILEAPPKRPIWHKFTPSLRGIQAEWLSPGSRRLDAPILWFYLNWTNLYTGRRHTLRLPTDQRAYYLSNLTCATTIQFQLCAENKVGNSSFTDLISWTTLGSAPRIANAVELIPEGLRSQTSVSLNFSTFLPGAGCAPLFYHVLVGPSEAGHFTVDNSNLINLTLTRADLITLDNGMGRDRCCYNLTQLNAGVHYQYRVIATNPAGSVSLQGQFWTLTVNGGKPGTKQSHLLGQNGILRRPAFIVPITALFAVILVLLVAIPLMCRHRRLEETLRPNKPVTQCQNDLHSDQPDGWSQSQQQQKTRLLSSHAYHPYHMNHRDKLPPLPGQQPDSQASTVLVSGRTGSSTRKNSKFFNFHRSKNYDQSRQQRNLPTTLSKDTHLHIDDDRLSTNSMDSEGNINPYATYAATGFHELTGTIAPVTTVGSNSTTIGNRPPVRGTSALVRQLSHGPQTRLDPSWNGAYKRNLRNGPDVPFGMIAHPYNYPNLNGGLIRTTGLSTTMGRPGRLVRVGSGSRLHNTGGGFIDPSRLTPATAALLDPTIAPYDNNSTLGASDAEILDLAHEMGHFPMMGHGPRAGMRRRVNSFESLNRIPRELAQTYHRGFGGAGGDRIFMPPTFFAPDGSLISPSMANPISLYDPNKSTDPSGALAYRGSVLSSTTASSNQDELTQAYEYGRKHQQNLRTPTVMMPSNLVGRLHPNAERPIPIRHPPHPNAVNPLGLPNTSEAEMSNESGSSEATDSGIRQFTQQPPELDKARHATCEPSANGSIPSSKFAVFGRHGANGPGGYRVGIPAHTSSYAHCPSEMTDTYASVDYNGTPYGPTGLPLTAGLMARGAPQREIYGPSLSRIRQPLPALPAPSARGYLEDGSSRTYGPTAYEKSMSNYYPSNAGSGSYNTDNYHRQFRAVPMASVGSYGTEQNNLSRVDSGTLVAQNSCRRNPSSSHLLQSGSTATTTREPPPSNPEESVYTSEFVLV